MKRNKLFGALLIPLAMVTTIQSGFAYTPQSLYDEVWKLINARFVNEDKNGQDWRIWRHRFDSQIKDEADANVAIETMLASLNDRYTRFLDKDEFAEEGRSIKATLFGIGIQIGLRDDKLVVIAPIDETPADKAGLKANDEILEIDGKNTKGISVKDAADLIRGEKGTKVRLLIKRDDKAAKYYDIMRDEIKLKSVSLDNPFSVSIPHNIGYIKLSTFLSSNAAQEVQNAMKDQGDKSGYILDLRSNPGGLLSNAIRIADFFLEEGSIVSTVDRDGYKEVRYSSPSVLTNKPLVVLINGGSASASEILSGALKDNKRAVLIGERSFGKGLVQEINQLPGGSGVNITTQRYLTPNDTDINKKGIEPDIAVELTEEDAKAKKDPQLQKAIGVVEEMVKGKTVKDIINQQILAKAQAKSPVTAGDSKKESTALPKVQPSAQ
ncbi:S41 family peptidase [Vampirovibrio chlorellavorus]|uniref:S41 family peptidase n=1 Tax=Vampirovibrio chlorellavorus TaxID=758823 RepID=UPI0026F23D1D|nr:S41 family peptidase [Vampirovibrio chlorellavorus]